MQKTARRRCRQAVLRKSGRCRRSDRGEIQASEKIACDFVRLDGYLFQGNGVPADIMDEELEAVREVGAPVHRLVGVPLRRCENRHVLRYPRQARFHPLKYLRGLAAACASGGVRFFANSPVEEVAEKDGAVTLRTSQGQIAAAGIEVVGERGRGDACMIETDTLFGEMPTLRRPADGREPAADVLSAAGSPLQVPEVSCRRGRSATPQPDAALRAPGSGRSLTRCSQPKPSYRPLQAARRPRILGVIGDRHRALQRGKFRILPRGTPNID